MPVHSFLENKNITKFDWIANFMDSVNTTVSYTCKITIQYMKFDLSLKQCFYEKRKKLHKTQTTVI